VRRPRRRRRTKAFESVQLYSAVPGYLQKQTVDLGDRVKKGQLLAEIDSPLLVVAMKQAELGVLRAQGRMHGAAARLVVTRTAVQAAQAFVVQRQAEADSAKALLTFRQQRLERIKSLYENKSVDARVFEDEQKGTEVSRAQHAAAQAALANARIAVELARGKVAQAEAALDVAKTGGEQARLALEKARIRLDMTRVVAPFDGVVTQRNFSSGDFIRGGAQGGRPLVTVVRTDRMRVIVQIPQREAVLLQPGALAELAFDALPGVPFKARVSRVGFAADPAKRTMRAEIDVPNPNEQFRPGMNGSATIHLGKGRAASPHRPGREGRDEPEKAPPGRGPEGL
jgi:HlyD family secretion protein